MNKAHRPAQATHPSVGDLPKAGNPCVGTDSPLSAVASHVGEIAALYVQTNGCYYGLDGVDPWDITRDARKYAGPYPVVAHPPCQLWTNMAAVNFKRYGGEHNRPGNDQACFASALAAVRAYGGVLEHPAFTNAWKAHGLPRPCGIGWRSATPNEWVCEVWQAAYGHKARKRTWLFYVGPRPFELNWNRPSGTHWIGNCDSKNKGRNKPTVTKKEAIATPIAFREALLALARHSLRSNRLAA